MIISVAKDFSDVPWGRYPTDGRFCGENFREELLMPALKSGENKIVVDLDGAEGYGSSFLEEAFGGLVRKHGFTSQDLRSKLEIRTSREEFKIYVDLIWQYIAGRRGLVAA
ncbi:MAG TPA: STAS-like domain-containing protein [Opitutaceae bacterium]|jgi:hypothetical protein|nr:STAS-like domain-containing protein [Opitutaceae bacterium]